MRRKELTGDEAKADSTFNHIFENALGIPILLDSAPTTAGGELPKNGDFGFFSGNLYINLAGTVRRIAYTDV